MIAIDHPSAYYRQPARRSLRQGDIALCEFSQLRHRNRDVKGPDSDVATPYLPSHGTSVDLEIPPQQWPFAGEPPVVRVWQGWVIVVTQGCVLDNADEDDSRLIIAPLATEERWPEGPWESGHLKQDVLPDYFYLPGLTAEAAEALGHKEEWPAAVVDLGSLALVSRGLVKSRRLLSLSTEALLPFQDKVSRSLTTRGYASHQTLKGLAGRKIVDVVQSDAFVQGPSRLSKVTIAEDENGEDDEITLFIGTRA